jgi:hypothetical protein
MNNKGDLHQHILDIGIQCPQTPGILGSIRREFGTNVPRMGRTGRTTKNDHFVLGWFWNLPSGHDEQFANLNMTIL